MLMAREGRVGGKPAHVWMKVVKVVLLHHIGHASWGHNNFYFYFTGVKDKYHSFTRDSLTIYQGKFVLNVMIFFSLTLTLDKTNKLCDLE